MARVGVHLTKFHRGQKLLPLYSPRTTYKTIIESDERLLSDISLNFDKCVIGVIKKEFELCSWSMNLNQFIGAVKRHLTSWQPELPNRDYRLVRCLTNLFDQIDINGNGQLQWDQFTNYIIEKATILKNLRVKNEQIKAYTRLSYKPSIKCDTTIVKVIHIPDLNRLAFFQQGSNVINFIDPETGECHNKPLVISPKQLVVNMSSVKKNKEGKVEIRKKELIVPTSIRVLDMLYINDDKYHLLVTATSDGFVRGWKFSTATGFVLASQPDNEQQFVQHQFTEEVYSIVWDGLNEVLFCSLKDGTIMLWNLKTDTEKPLQENRNDGQGHTMMIMDMITIPKLHFMASGGMDGKVILWDTINNRIKWVYKEHTRCVLTLTYNEQLILLLSAGFDHKICIWNPYISSLIHKIESHNSPIYKLKVLENTYQLVSLDSDGIVKIHDIRRFNFLTSFSVDGSDDTKKLNANSFTVLQKPLKLCFVGRSIAMFQYDKSYNPICADENISVSCKYHQNSLRFYTAHGNRIKVWSALTGQVDYVFLDVCKAEITAFCMDEKQRTMAVGNIEGGVVMLNSLNGARLSNLTSHNGEITHIVASVQNQKNIFMTVGTDNIINISREVGDTLGYELIRAINVRKDANISTILFNTANKHITVGTNIGAIGFYESETGKLVTTLTDGNYEEVTSLCMTGQILVATNSVGCISVLTMPPRISKFQKLLTMMHVDPQKPGANCQLGIITACYSETLKRFFVVDEKMFITCYNFESLHASVFSVASQDSSHAMRLIGARRHAQKLDKFANFKLQVCWCTKVHNEPVRFLDYIDQEELLVTTSFDKTVKLWRAKNGEYVDSLQQNYDNGEAVPLAYQKFQTKQLYKSDFSKVLGYQITRQQGEFDPFASEDIVTQAGLKLGKSHPNWRLNINFRANYEEKERRYARTLTEVKQSAEGTANKQKKYVKGTTTPQMPQQNQSSVRQRLSQICNRQDVQTSQQKQVKDSQTQVKKSNTTMTNPIYQRVKKSILQIDPASQLIAQYRRTKTKEETRKQKENHRKYIDRLASQQIQAKLAVKDEVKVVLSRKEAEAAARLGKALLDFNSDDKRSQGLLSSFVVKQNSQGTLPRI